MKVCLVTPEFRPTWGGVGAYTYHLARQLRDEMEVHILTANGLRVDPGYVPDGVRVHYVDYGEPTKRGSHFLFQVGVFRALPDLSAKHRFDIIHANHAYMSDLLVRLRRYLGARVLTVHSTLDSQTNGTKAAGEDSPAQPIEREIARWRHVLQPVERYYLKQTPSIIFVSRWVRNRTEERYGFLPQHHTVVPNGVDTRMFSPRAPKEEFQFIDDGRPTLLFAGRLLALKGIATLLKSLTYLDPSVRLLIAGPGKQVAWKSMASHLGLNGEQVRFLGPVPYESMPALYRQVTAAVLPSYVESCPMVALEAMASGTPLIAAESGGISEVVHDGETGWLFQPGNVRGLTSRIVSVFTRPDEVKRITRQARAYTEAFGTVDRMGDWTRRFYREALNGGTAS